MWSSGRGHEFDEAEAGDDSSDNKGSVTCLLGPAVKNIP